MPLLIRITLLICSVLQLHQSSAQKIIWADEVIGFSSQGGVKALSADQVLGKPNAIPAMEMSSVAWMPDIRSRQPEEWIKVSFPNPVFAEQVIIAQNLKPGSVSRIYLFDLNQKVLQIFPDSTAGSNQVKETLWTLNIDRTSEKISSLLLVLDSAIINVSQIDAIGISDKKDIQISPINIRPGLDSLPPPVNLGPSINSFYNEVFPVISPDGKVLYFDRKNHPGNFKSAQGREENDDIWYSLLDKNGDWLKAKNIGVPLNNGYHNFICSISPDGNTMLLGNAYYPDGTITDGLSISHKDTSGWSLPVPLNILNYYNDDPYGEFQLTSNGKVILMAVERKDGMGNRDLYASFFIRDHQWSSPVHLGNDINSAGREMSPFLASDMSTLYFSSDGFPGFGGNDMFVSKRLDESWIKWSEPVNLGSAINSPELDAYYTIPASGDHAYFASSNRSIGKADIFRIPLPEDIQPDPVVLISGRVLEQSEESMQSQSAKAAPVYARITYYGAKDAKEVGIASSNPRNGSYSIVLPYGSAYQFRAEADGYFALTENIDLRKIDSYRELEIDLRLIPVREGEIIPIRDIYFEVNRAVLLEESDRELNRVVEFMQQNPLVKIEVAGHTNDRCSEAFCKQLSDRRAKSVARYLTKQGIDELRITWQGYGSDKPIADNSTEEGRQLNQRVEFLITSTESSESSGKSQKER